MGINTSWHPISYHFEVITDYCYFWWKPVTLHFWATLWGLNGTVNLRLIGKLV